MDEGTFANVFRPAADGPYCCPCCGYITLGERGGYEICPWAPGKTTDGMNTTLTGYAATRTGN